jgi:putative addiction module component (TIGR02574 family)
MSAEVDTLIHNALSLSPEKRILLAEKIWESLDEAERDNDAAWAKEAEDRLEAFERGELKALPFDDVMRELRD